MHFLMRTIAGAGCSSKLQPEKADEFIKHRCLLRSPRRGCQLAHHIVAALVTASRMTGAPRSAASCETQMATW